MGLSLLFLRLLKLHDLDLFLIYLFFVSFCFSFSFHPPSSLRTPTHHHYRIPLVKIKNTTHPPNLFIYIVCLFVGLMDHVLIPFNPPSVFDPHFPIIKRFRLNTHITHIPIDVSFACQFPTSSLLSYYFRFHLWHFPICFCIRLFTICFD